MSIYKLNADYKEDCNSYLLQETLAGNVDDEFLPYLHRINKLPYCVTNNCCIGHAPYPEEFKQEGYWGYLAFSISFGYVASLSVEAKKWKWLLPMSKLFMDGPEPPTISECGTRAYVGASWKAEDFEEAVEELCVFLESLKQIKSLMMEKS